MLLRKHCERFCIRSNKSSGSGWKTIQELREKQNHDCHIAWRTRALLLPVPLLCCRDGRCCGRCHPRFSLSPMSHAKKGWVGLPHPEDLLCVRLEESVTDAKRRQGREQKSHTKATLTVTSFSGDTFTPFTSSSSGSSFSLLSVQETESWTEQVLSKSGKLVDGYFRKSPSADSYPRDNKTCYIACRKPPKSR